MRYRSPLVQRSWLRRLSTGLLVIASVIVTLTASDIFLRVIGYAPTLSQAWMLDEAGRWQLPNRDIIVMPTRFTEHDFFDVDPKHQTIVTLGDSFTYGFPVASADSYPSVLGKKLRDRNWVVNILNLGLGDSGTDRQLRLFKQYVLPKVEPDIVIWTFYANDIRDNFLQAVYEIVNNELVALDAAEHWLYRRQTIYRFIPLPLSIKKSSPLIAILFRAMEVIANGRILGEPEEARIARSKAKIKLAMAEMEKLARFNGFEVYFAVVAPQSSYLNKSEPGLWDDNQLILYDKELRSLFSLHGPFIDVRFDRKRKQGCGRAIGLNEEAIPEPSELFSDGRHDPNRLGHRHFNELGYSLFADLVSRCLLTDHASAP